MININKNANNNKDLLSRALALALAEVAPVLVESLADLLAEHLIKKITNNSSCDDLFGSNVSINSKDLKNEILVLGHSPDVDEHIDSCTCHVDEVKWVVPLRLFITRVGVAGLVNN